MLNDDEIVFGDAECVHVRWMQSPSGHLCAHHIRIVKHLMAVREADDAVFGTSRRHCHAQIENLKQERMLMTIAIDINIDRKVTFLPFHHS